MDGFNIYEEEFVSFEVIEWRKVNGGRVWIIVEKWDLVINFFIIRLKIDML